MNAQGHPAVSTYQGMQQRINAAYVRMAKDNGAVVAPVGVAWQKVRQDKPVIGLYADNVHPNATGAYLAACVLYATIFKDSPLDRFRPESLGAGQARYLQQTANDTVFSPRQRWRWDR